MRVFPDLDLLPSGYFRDNRKKIDEKTCLLLSVGDSRSSLSSSSSSIKTNRSYGSFISIQGLKSLWNWSKQVQNIRYKKVMTNNLSENHEN